MAKKTLRQFVALDVTTLNMCIKYPDEEYELKFGLIHLLPKFHGLVEEGLKNHLKEFHVVHL